MVAPSPITINPLSQLQNLCNRGIPVLFKISKGQEWHYYLGFGNDLLCLRTLGSKIIQRAGDLSSHGFGPLHENQRRAQIHMTQELLDATSRARR